MREESQNKEQDPVNSKSAGHVWLNQGNDLLEQHQYAEALAVFEQALQLDVQDARLYGAQGLTLGELGRHEEALVAYELALPWSQMIHLPGITKAIACAS